MDFEKKIKELENIVEAMEAGELSLEESLKKFEKGVKLTRECQDQLAKAELKVKKLMISEEGEEQLEDYVVTEED